MAVGSRHLRIKGAGTALRHLQALGNDRSGSVALIGAFGLTIALTGVGYALDVHAMTSTASRLQDIADAAALAGAAQGTRAGATEAMMKGEAERIGRSMLYGMRGGEPAIVARVKGGPEREVEVEVRKPTALFFGQMFKDSTVEIARTAAAVAGTKTPVCMLVLEPAAAGALSMQGTPDLVAPDCAVQVNSSSASAVETGGNASATTKATLVRGKPAGKGGGGGNFKPAPTFGSPVLNDPLASRITWPNPSGCDYTNGVATKAKVTLSPGVYCGGISAATHAEITLNPGVYVIRTGGLSLSSGGLIKGTGVTIVLVDPTGDIDIGSKGSLQLEAPKGGHWAGIALAVKPQPTRIVSNMQGGGELKLDGIVYLPTQQLHLTGGGEMEGSISNRMFVVNSIQMNGNGQIRLKGDPALMAVGGSVRLKS